MKRRYRLIFILMTKDEKYQLLTELCTSNVVAGCWLFYFFANIAFC